MTDKVVILSGSGLSAESGLPTFRDSAGMWKQYDWRELASPDGWREHPEVVLAFYNERRARAWSAQPNAAHRAIAALPGAVVVTQNVDGLHARAGARDIVELHGNIFRVRCVREGGSCDAPDAFDVIPPHCACGSLLRPDVVWFGEMLPDEAVARAMVAIRGADLLVVIGTSGVVYPAAGMVSLHRGLSIEINPAATPLTSNCTYAIATTAAEATPQLVDAIQEACHV